MTEGDQIHELAALVRAQMGEITRLRAENNRLHAELQAFVAWADSDLDALTYLQRTYSNPNESVTNRTKTALGALPFERSKPASVVITADWTERTRSARLAQLELDRAEWARQEAQPQLDLPESPVA
jgi:hypothetical protein